TRSRDSFRQLSSHFTSRGFMPKQALKLPRRTMIRRSAGAPAALTFAPHRAPLCAGAEKRRFRIGACDWSIGKLGDPAAFEVAKQIGLDGVQVSLGTVADEMRLRKPDVQQQYKDAAKKAGLEIASLAIGEMNNVPYKSDPRTIEWVRDCID